MQKKKYDKRLYNTKLLLRNYKTLKQHYESAVTSIGEIEHNEITSEIESGFGSTDKNYVKAILRTRGRTIIIVKHIDRLLSHYRMKAEIAGGNELRKYKVVEGLYLADDRLTMEKIAENNDCSIGTVKNDHNKAINELSVLLFGIDGLVLWE